MEDTNDSAVLSRKRSPDALLSERRKLSKEESQEIEIFDRLRREVLLKILSCLSATDLATVSAVSRSLRDLASEDALWHRLYTARSPCPRHPVRVIPVFRWKLGDEEEDVHKVSWKTLYFRREHRETTEVLETVPVDMQQARRCTSLGPCSFVVLATRPAPSWTHVLSSNVRKWMQRHSFDINKVKTVTSGYEAVGPFVEIDGTFISETTGDVHICDEACQERLLAIGQTVCPISCFAVCSLPLEREASSGDEAEEEDADYSGRLGRAFAAGYGCSDETEFRKLWNF